MKNKDLISSKKLIKNTIHYNLPFCVDKRKIIGISKNFLNKQEIESISYEFSLPIQYSFLKPGDVIEIKFESNKKTQFIIQEIIFYTDFLKINAFRYFPQMYNLNSFSIFFENFRSEFDSFFFDQMKKNSKTFLKLTQIPILNKKNYNPNGALGFFVSPMDETLNWNGSSLFKFNQNSNNSEIFIGDTQKPNIFGKIIKINKRSLEKISPLLVDFDSEIIISIPSKYAEKIFNLSDEDFFSFKNLAKIGDEIIAFQNIEFIQNNVYKIKTLLRGLFGTESFIQDEKTNQNFYFIDENFLNFNVENSMIGDFSFFKAVTFGEKISSFKESKIFLRNLYSLQHHVCNFEIKKIKNSDDKFQISFQKRLRINDSQFVSDFEQDFESFKYVIFQNSNSEIKKIDLPERSNGFLIKIFENGLSSKPTSENVISDLNFEFTIQKKDLEKIYIEIGSLNSAHLNYFYSRILIDLKNLEILDIEYLNNIS